MDQFVITALKGYRNSVSTVPGGCAFQARTVLGKNDILLLSVLQLNTGRLWHENCLVFVFLVVLASCSSRWQSTCCQFYLSCITWISPPVLQTLPIQGAQDIRYTDVGVCS